MAEAPASVLEELYAVPLSAFTRERNARAAALKRAGDADTARAVQALRKPTATLWATNQLARAEPERLERFVDSVERVRRSQLRDGRAAAEAMRAQRAELDALVERAEELLKGAGFRASPDTTREISNTLLGAAVDPQRAKDLRRGRLTEPLGAPGFEVLAGAPAGGHLRLLPGGATTHGPAPRGARRDEPDRDETRRRPSPARATAAGKRQQAAERRRAAAEARQQAAEARQAAAEAERQRRRREAEERAQRVAARRAEVERLEAEARRLTSALADSRRRLREERRLVKRAARPRPPRSSAMRDDTSP